MEGNDEIFNRVMSDKQFRTAAQERIAGTLHSPHRGAATVRRVRPGAEHLGPLTTTFLLAMATPMILLPLERVR